jgi:hypothetical protein
MKSYFFGKLKLDYHKMTVGFFDQSYLDKSLLRSKDSEQARQIKVLQRVRDLSQRGDLTQAYMLIDIFIRGSPHFAQWQEKARARIYAEEALGVVKEQANLYM